MRHRLESSAVAQPLLFLKAVGGSNLTTHLHVVRVLAVKQQIQTRDDLGPALTTLVTNAGVPLDRELVLRLVPVHNEARLPRPTAVGKEPTRTRARHDLRRWAILGQHRRERLAVLQLLFRRCHHVCNVYVLKIAVLELAQREERRRIPNGLLHSLDHPAHRRLDGVRIMDRGIVRGWPKIQFRSFEHAARLRVHILPKGIHARHVGGQARERLRRYRGSASLRVLDRCHASARLADVAQRRGREDLIGLRVEQHRSQILLARHRERNGRRRGACRATLQHVVSLKPRDVAHTGLGLPALILKVTFAELRVHVAE